MFSQILNLLTKKVSKSSVLFSIEVTIDNKMAILLFILTIKDTLQSLKRQQEKILEEKW
jgi:hypothetical protein